MSLIVNVQKTSRNSQGIDRGKILREGWNIVFESTVREGWGAVDVEVLDSRIALSWLESRNAFIWSEEPPKPSSLCQHWSPPHIQEWEANIAEDDLVFITKVEELGDFEHASSSESSMLTLVRGSQTPTEVIEAIGQIFNPKYHYLRPLHPSVISGVSGLAFSKHPCTAVAPYCGASPVECLGSAWARCAWIVPVHGRMDIVQCSHAQFCSDPSSREEINIATSKSSASVIVWTPNLLPAFWEFLQALRSSVALGSISLSIHTPTIAELSREEQIGHNALYHFKIYQDANVALHVRNALDLWGAVQDGTNKKIRPLKGRYLLLVSDKNQPVLIA